MARFSLAVAAGGLFLANLAEAREPYTPKHEAGRCAIRGQCGKQSLFGGELPCVDNGLAEEPDDGLRERLVSLCGPAWGSGPVCCSEGQVISTSPPVQ